MSSLPPPNTDADPKSAEPSLLNEADPISCCLTLSNILVVAEFASVLEHQNDNLKI